VQLSFCPLFPDEAQAKRKGVLRLLLGDTTFLTGLPVTRLTRARDQGLRTRQVAETRMVFITQFPWYLCLIDAPYATVSRSEYAGGA
jgi:hypothetical protein